MGLELRRALRGAGERALAEVVALLAGPARVEDAAGMVLAGDPAATGERHEIRFEDIVVGAVVGPPGSERVAALASHLFAKEHEKRALVDETLGRYKELTLVYEMSDKLSTLLDLDAVAGLVIHEAQRHLRASGASILLHDPRTGRLEVVVAVGEEQAAPRELPADQGVEGRVLRNGRAEFIDDIATTDTQASVGGVRSLICAPLRVGERVFGVLRVSLSAASVTWTSGDLKLVAALAAQAASAISNAQLHRDRLRELALRHQVERLVSMRLLDVAFDGAAGAGEADVVVAFCDLRQLSSLDRVGDADRLLLRIEAGVVAAVRAFLAEGATVDTPQGELVVGLFWEPDAVAGAFSGAAARAVRSAHALLAALHLDGRGGPGVGIAAATLLPGDPAALRTALNTAAMLQHEAEGRVLVGPAVAAALPGASRRAIGERLLPGGVSSIFEVRA